MIFSPPIVQSELSQRSTATPQISGTAQLEGSRLTPAQIRHGALDPVWNLGALFGRLL